MPRNESGQYIPPPGTTAVPNTTIASAPYNALKDDMADALTESLPRTGVAPMLGDLPMNGNKITGLEDGTDPGDAVTRGQLDAKLNADASNVGDAEAQEAFRAAISAPLRGHIWGLTLANNSTDSANDIDIAPGEAASTEANPALMVLASGLTKRLDEAWAAGTDNGGLDTGAIADGIYHVFLIRRSDTGVVDALFSGSADNPTMPTSYDQKRRIGSFLRRSGGIVAFVQVNDEFKFRTPIVDISVNDPGTSAIMRSLSVPVGFPVDAILNVNLAMGSPFETRLYLSDPAVNDQTPDTAASPLATIFTVGAGSPISGSYSAPNLRVRTNSVAQIRSRFSDSSGAVNLRIATLGWIDTRGKDA